MEKFFVWLRWACLGPVTLGGIVLGFAVGIFANLQIGGETAEKYGWIFLAGDVLGGFLSAGIGVLVAASIAPDHKKRAAWTVGLICLGISSFPFFASHTWSLSKGDVVEWLLVALGMILGATGAMGIISLFLGKRR